MARTATAKTAPTTTEAATTAATATTDAPTTAAPAPHAAALAELREIAVAGITTDGRNPRTLFDLDGEAGIRELAASITAHGLVQPITVRANLDAGEGAPPYLLVAGERRLRAIRDVLKRRTIAAILRHDLTEDTALEATVLENLQRRDLHPMEEARGLTQLRAGRGYTVEQIAKKLGRGKEWVKDRLKLCDLPATTQDLYLRDTAGRLTLTKMLKLHEYTHGNKDNTGFPRLIEAMAEDIAKGVNSDAHPSTTASLHTGLVKRLTHWHTDQGGRYGDNYFDTYAVCRACPFAAYRSPYGDYEGFCLMPDHYAALHAKGKARWEEAEAARQKNAPAVMPGADLINASGPGGYTRPVARTAAQKGKETRARRAQQKADYMPNVLAVRRTVDLIPSIEVHDLATLAAYTLSHVSLNKEDWGEIARRHGVDAGALMRAGGSTRPSVEHITGLRKLDPLGLVKATIEALLIRQAQAARDYEPDNYHSAGPDLVFKLYTGDQTSASAPPAPAFAPVGVIGGIVGADEGDADDEGAAGEGDDTLTMESSPEGEEVCSTT